MSGTHPTRWSYEDYLAAKVPIDDRALNRVVIDVLKDTLKTRTSSFPIRVTEIGGGTGTMVRRAIEWGLISRSEYTLLDADGELLAKGLKALEGWASSAGLVTETGDGTLRLRRADGSVDVRVRTHHAEIFEYVSARQGAGTDLLIASAFLDLVELPRVLPELMNLLAPGGLFWFPINFDGETILEPGHPLDEPLIAAYHRTMDERVRYGRPAGDSRTGRKLFHAIETAGGKVLAAGSSDWAVFPRDGRYPAAEGYFVRCILSTIDEALSQRDDVSKVDLATWLQDRLNQLERGTLVYLAHQLDFLGTKA